MYLSLLAPDEPLSPELVLVLPPELRAQVLARLPPPAAWSRSRPRRAVAPAGDPVARTLRSVLLSRAVQLAQVFVAITILTIVMALVAKAFR